jgi:hypothetical protein
MRRAIPPVVLGVWLVSFAPSCSGPDVTLATLPAGDDAATPPSPRCASSTDCGSFPGTYCDKPSCDSPSGTCVLPPVECDNEEKPVCGCDGLTYFDHCLRQASLSESETPGPCPGFTCGGPSRKPCAAPGTYCAQLGGMGHCSPDAEGTCWVLPAQCPPASPGGNLWDSCSPGKHCVDTCDAIRMGGSYGRAFMCP